MYAYSKKEKMGFKSLKWIIYRSSFDREFIYIFTILYLKIIIKRLNMEKYNTFLRFSLLLLNIRITDTKKNQKTFFFYY